MHSPSPLVLVIAVVLSPLAAQTATAACCTLRKIDADPPSAHIRACDPVATPSCTTWLYDGTLTAGESASVCAASDRVLYQERDPATEAWGPTTEARCEDGGDVEL